MEKRLYKGCSGLGPLANYYSALTFGTLYGS